MSLRLPLRFAILASGAGSNAEVLLQAFKAGYIPASLGQIVWLCSNKAGAQVLAKGAAYGVETSCIPHALYPERVQHEQVMLQELAAREVDHLLLAGYLRVLSPYFLQYFPGSILNIHPALLPDFPGLAGAAKQWRAKRSIAGATVHLVDSGIDTGQILLNGSLEVRGDEGEAGLAERILTEVEHVIYKRAVKLFIERLISA